MTKIIIELSTIFIFPYAISQSYFKMNPNQQKKNTESSVVKTKPNQPDSTYRKHHTNL